MVSIRNTVVGLGVLAAGLALTSTAPASAVTDELLASSDDAAGDVRIRPGSRLTYREKQSIDIRNVEVRRVGAKAQVVVTMRDVIRARTFDQMFFVTFTERADAPDGQWITDAGFTTKGLLSYATYHSADWSRYDNCNRITVEVRAAEKQVIATIPRACTPQEPARVSVVAMTGTFRSDAPQSSVDRHSVPGHHDFAS